MSHFFFILFKSGGLLGQVKTQQTINSSAGNQEQKKKIDVTFKQKEKTKSNFTQNPPKNYFYIICLVA